MKKMFLLAAIATIAFASCTKTDVAPFVASAGTASLGASAKAKPVTPPPTTTPAPPAAGGGSGKGGGGNGGGGGAAPAPTNLQVFTKWLTGSWQSSLFVSFDAPTIVLQVVFKSDGTFTALTTDNANGAHTSFAGKWQFTIPPNIGLTESGLLVLTNTNGTIIMSGLTYFARPGEMIYGTPTNNLAPPIQRTGYAFVKT